MRNPIQLSHTERLYEQNLYLCVLMKGKSPDGQSVYAYFGIFLEDFFKLASAVRKGLPVNPKDFNAIVLARALGEPSESVQELMTKKFSFGHPGQDVILEISRRQG